MYLSLFCFLLALSADTAMTVRGTGWFTIPENEANPAVVWIWEMLDEWKIFAPAVWAFVFVSMAAVCVKMRHPALGTWFVLTGAIGHSVGFATWLNLPYFDEFWRATFQQSTIVSTDAGWILVRVLLYGAVSFVVIIFAALMRYRVRRRRRKRKSRQAPLFAGFLCGFFWRLCV